VGDLQLDWNGLGPAAFAMGLTAGLLLGGALAWLASAWRHRRRLRRLDELAGPIGDSLARVDARLHQVECERRGDYGSISKHLELIASSHHRLESETANLVAALRAPHVRGRWGELQLRRVVELAGMQAHCDFAVQPSVEREAGRLRPDLVVRLPAGPIPSCGATSSV